MQCPANIPVPNLFITSGNRGNTFPVYDCPIETAVKICPLVLQEGEDAVLYLETGNFIAILCSK